MGLSAGSAYVGAWINYEHGLVKGSTLTVSAQSGAILVSALTMLVTWTGTQFWSLLCFVLHHLRSSSRAKDALHYQQQVLLRSQVLQSDMLYRLLQTGFAWRSSTRGSIRRTLPLFMITAATTCVFILAGIFSSRVPNVNDLVLAQGKCGFLKGVDENSALQDWTAETIAYSDVFNFAAYSSYRDANRYARSCYGNQVDSSTKICNIFTVPSIPSIRDNNAPCPFDDKVCLAPAVSFDTGRISSDTHLGMNSRSGDRVYMRKKMTCAPIAVEEYSDEWSTKEKEGIAMDFETPLPNDTYKYFNYGPKLSNNVASGNYSLAFSGFAHSSQTQAHSLSAISYFPQLLPASHFLPIPEFNRSDADLTLIFRSTKILYTQPVTDVWFKATTKQTSIPGLENFYISDQSIAVMGCIEQYQACNEDKCTPLDGGFALPRDPKELDFNAMQNATYSLMIKYIEFMRMDIILAFLKNEVLLASQLSYPGAAISSAVESTQWQTEMENLFNVSLAGFQSHGLYHAAPGNAQIRPGTFMHDFVVPETTSENIKLCQSQKFRSKDYLSFNLLGLGLVFGISFLVTFLNMVLPMTVSWMLGWKRGGSVSKTAWIEDDILHLHRMALERRGVGPWRTSGAGVPVTESWGLKFSSRQEPAQEYAGNVQYEVVQMEDGRKY